MRRLADANAYDRECTDYLKTYHTDYMMKVATTYPVAGVPRVGTQEVQAHVLMRGSELVPRRIYIKPADFDRHGHTEGCKGCTWLKNRLGPRVLHSEGCRVRLENMIGEDETDD